MSKAPGLPSFATRATLGTLPAGKSMMRIRKRWSGYCVISKQKLQSRRREMAEISLCSPVEDLNTSPRFDRLRRGWFWWLGQSRHKRGDRGRDLVAGGVGFWWLGRATRSKTALLRKGTSPPLVLTHYDVLQRYATLQNTKI